MGAMGALGVAFCLLCLPCVGAQMVGTDFLYINCGAPAEYTDEHGITWRADDAYVSTGAVGLTTSTGVRRELLNCRYFQNSRGKNCYSLPTTPERTYMLRAEFKYGNYDGAGAAGPPYPSFRMVIDSTVVENVTIHRGLHFNHIRELTFKALRNETSLCLLRDQTNSTPFISSIALRLVDTLPSYILLQASKNKFASTMARVYFENSNNVIVYPGDMYDRYWFASGGGATNPYPLSELGATVSSSSPVEFTSVNSSTTIDTTFPDASLRGNTPQEAIRSAMTTSGNLSFAYQPANSNYPSFPAYVLAYFVEFDESVSTTDRPFYVAADATGKGTPFRNNLRNATASALSLRITEHMHINIDPDSKFVMYPDESRTDPSAGPMISALEVFKVGTPSVPPTNDRDWSGIASLKNDMGLTSWRGDPCLPVPHDWLTCTSVDEHLEASVLEILLSGYNLTGAISPAFADLLSVSSLKLDDNSLSGPIPDLRALKNLKTLHLQNNKLTGPLPSWLAFLPLQELFVQNNDLSGTIPSEFLTKNWNFISSGNPKLRTAGPGVFSPNSVFSLSNRVFWSRKEEVGTGKKKKKTNVGALIGEILAAIVVFGAIVGIIVYCCCCRNRTPRSKDLETVEVVSVANPNEKHKTDLAASSL